MKHREGPGQAVLVRIVTIHTVQQTLQTGPLPPQGKCGAK